MLPGVMVIDEPELGLHPAAVRTIAQLVRAVSSKRQVVVATQSPGFVAAFRPEEVVLMQWQPGSAGRGYSTARRLSREELGSWLDDYDLGQLFEKNVTGGAPE